MSLRHPKAIAWEKELKRVFDTIDVALEDKYGEHFPLHPVRAAEGETANPEYDGLFGVGASFSAGYGSEHGAGYIVRLKLSTLSNVPKDLIREMEDFVVAQLQEALPKAFPDRQLHVSRDGNAIKIHGDLSLGHA
jgi:hypothetical protein